jgi:hypothetical protein
MKSNCKGGRKLVENEAALEDRLFPEPLLSGKFKKHILSL